MLIAFILFLINIYNLFFSVLNHFADIFALRCILLVDKRIALYFRLTFLSIHLQNCITLTSYKSELVLSV